MIKLEFYKTNAYPEIFLHDCRFRILYESQALSLVFEDGFCKQEENGVVKAKGSIRFSDLSLNNITIRAYKGKQRFGRYFESVTYLSFSDLNKLLQKQLLEVIDEYYCCGQVLYTCCLYPYQIHQPFDRIDIHIIHDQQAPQYYLL